MKLKQATRASAWDANWDAWSRKIIGWSMANHLRAELVIDALDMALGQRRPADGVIVHSDQGSQYTSVAFGRRCKKAGVRPSMGSVGDAYDTAMCESLFATLECELLDRRNITSTGRFRECLQRRRWRPLERLHVRRPEWLHWHT